MEECKACLTHYNKQPEELKIAQKTMVLGLTGYGYEEIEKAFNEHLFESEIFPTPKNILVIIRKNRKHRASMAQYKTARIERKITKYKDLSLEDQKELDNIFEEAKSQLAPLPKKNYQNDQKQDYSDYNRLNSEQKAAVLAEMKRVVT